MTFLFVCLSRYLEGAAEIKKERKKELKEDEGQVKTRGRQMKPG